MPLFANEVKNGPASSDKYHSTANQGSCHVHGTMPAYFPCPVFFSSTKPTFKTDCAN